MRAVTVILTCILANSVFSFNLWGTNTEQQDQIQDQPSFCGSYECPDFTVVQTYQDYELRQYEQTKYITVQMALIEDWANQTAMKQAFMKLFKYIGGENQQGVKIPMTVPVVQGYVQNKAWMGFMLPKNLASNPPMPTDGSLKFVQLPRSAVYVRSFGGWPYGIFWHRNNFQTNLEALKASLERDSQRADDTNFYAAQYNSPWQIFGRHNEIWLIKV